MKYSDCPECEYWLTDEGRCEYSDCLECEYWLPDEEQCEYPDLPPCLDCFYKRRAIANNTK